MTPVPHPITAILECRCLYCEIDDKITRIVEKHRFRKESIYLLMEILEFAFRSEAKARKADLPDTVLTAEMIVKWSVVYGVKVFGPLSIFVFDTLGLRSAGDFGPRMYALAEEGLIPPPEDRPTHIPGFEDLDIDILDRFRTYFRGQLL